MAEGLDTLENLDKQTLVIKSSMQTKHRWKCERTVVRQDQKAICGYTDPEHWSQIPSCYMTIRKHEKQIIPENFWKDIMATAEQKEKPRQLGAIIFQRECILNDALPLFCCKSGRIFYIFVV